MVFFRSQFLAGALFLLGLPMGESYGVCLDPPGDLDGTGEVNVVDVQCDILLVLWELSNDSLLPLPTCLDVGVDAADLNCDSDNNVTDVLLLIQYALDVPLGKEIDEDGDQCPDACVAPSPQGQVQMDGPDVVSIDGCAPVEVWLEPNSQAVAYTDDITLSGEHLVVYQDASCVKLLSGPVTASDSPVTIGVRPVKEGAHVLQGVGPASSPGNVEMSVSADSFANDTRGLETLVVFNENFPGGELLAEYYADSRGIPEENICPVWVSTGTYGSTQELLGARQQIVENCLCPLAEETPCSIENIQEIHDNISVTHLALMKGIPLRLTGTAWSKDDEEGSFGHYLSVLLTRTLDGVFENVNGIQEAGFDYPNVATSYFYNHAFSPTPKLIPELHGYMAYSQVEAITVERTLDLIDRTLASEKSGFLGNGIVEGIPNSQTSYPPSPSSYPLYYALNAFEPACTDYLSFEPFISGAPESTWPHELCRWGSTECDVDGCLEGIAPGNASSPIPVAINGGFFAGLDHRHGKNPINNQSTFNGFAGLRKWHVTDEPCVEFCTSFSSPEEVESCQESSLDYFKEFNSDCVGVAPGFMGSQTRSYTVQHYGFLPADWSGSSGGKHEHVAPMHMLEGGFQNEVFTDSQYIHFGTYSHEELDSSTCLIDGVSVACPERLAIRLKRNLSLSDSLVVDQERKFLLTVRYRNQGYPQANLQLRLEYWGEQNSGNNPPVAKKPGGGTPSIALSDTHTTWQEASFEVVVPEESETLITQLRLDLMGQFNQKIHGFLDLDGIEVVDLETGTHLMPVAIGSFAPANHHKVHSGEFATDVIDRLGGIAWWGSSSHFAEGGFAYGDSDSHFGRLMMGRTMGESVASEEGRSGLVFGDPIYRSTAVKISSGKEEGYMSFTSGSPGHEFWEDSLPEDSSLFVRVLRGTDYLDSVRWELSRCDQDSPFLCGPNDWEPVLTGVGAVRDYPVSAFSLVPSPVEDWSGVIRLRQWRPDMELEHLNSFGKLTYYAHPKPPCPWDLTGNGVVDMSDSNLILLSIPCSDEELELYDLDDDGDVDGEDIQVLIGYFQSGSTPEEAGCCDYNDDGQIWLEDLVAIQEVECGQPVPENADINGDGVVDEADVDLVMENTGVCPK